MPTFHFFICTIRLNLLFFFSFLQVMYVVSIDLDDWSLDHNFLPCISWFTFDRLWAIIAADKTDSTMQLNHDLEHSSFSSMWCISVVGCAWVLSFSRTIVGCFVFWDTAPLGVVYLCSRERICHMRASSNCSLRSLPENHGQIALWEACVQMTRLLWLPLEVCS
jgi:hypothetical protein